MPTFSEIKREQWKRVTTGVRNIATGILNLGRPAATRVVSVTDLRIHAAFRSAFVPLPRDLIVYVPPEYDREPERRYPVMYLQDGQNLFDPATAFIPGKDWRADDTAEELIRRGAIEPLIMVGIYNTKDRLLEYTPTADARKGGGKADLYGRMLLEEIKPFIDRTYRTLPDETALGGSSLGGLVTLYLGLEYPEVFRKLAVLSPSVWWDNQYIVKRVAALASKPEMKIWLDMGTREGGMSLQDTEALRDVLLKRGWVEGEDLIYAEVEGAHHEETAWAQRVGPFLKYLFPAKGGRRQ
jgi:predicted alpha/beta superfamily hydrolase